MINFNWGEDEIIERVSSDYTSVEWTGYLKPLYSELYTFYVNSNDGIYVEIGDQVLINWLTDVIAEGDTLT